MHGGGGKNIMEGAALSDPSPKYVRFGCASLLATTAELRGARDLRRVEGRRSSARQRPRCRARPSVMPRGPYISSKLALAELPTTMAEVEEYLALAPIRVITIARKSPVTTR